MEVASESPILRLPRFPGRSKGIHLSGIIRCIAIEGNLLQQKYLEELELVDMDSDIIDEPSTLIKISMGLAWESYYLGYLETNYGIAGHASELHLDDIYLSPDGEELSVIAEPRRMLRHYIHEVKCTYKSTRTVSMFDTSLSLKKNWMWLAQIKAYCKAAKTLFCKLHVLFVCGDYKFPITPQLKIFTIKFTQDELDENWELMKDYKFYRLQLQKGT